MSRTLKLSPEQLACVSSQANALVVVAGAGSGKTEVVARRLERLLNEDPAAESKVLAVTYTVKAADELRDRLQSRLGDLHRRASTDTIHGFALTCIRDLGPSMGMAAEPEILSRNEDRAAILEDWLGDAGIAPPQKVLDTLVDIDLARARIGDAPYLADWREAMASRSALDFPAMLDTVVSMLDDDWVTSYLRRIYTHVIVDEAQNLTAVQYRLLSKLVGVPGSQVIPMTMVGDERQSIIGFAGADRRLIATFEAEYAAERIELKVNYRSAKLIVDLGSVVAGEMSAPSSAKYSEDDLASGNIEIAECSDEESEGEEVASWIAQLLSAGLPPDALAAGEDPSVRPEDTAVLARSAAALRPAAQALSRRGIAVASASGYDDWVATTAARVIVECVAYRSASTHATTRNRLSALLGVSTESWSDLKRSLRDSGSGLAGRSCRREGF